MITDTTEIYRDMVAWVLYDGDCSMCTSLATRFAPLLGRRGFHFAPLQTGWVRARLGMSEEELLREMRVLTADGRVYGGAEAVVYLARQIWWAIPLVMVSRLPGGMGALRAAYRWIAERRSCRQGRCIRPSPKPWLAWTPLVVGSAVVLRVGRHLEPWQFMWTLSFVVFLGFKWWMFWINRRPAPAWRVLAYFLWPGMDAGAFLETRESQKAGSGEWAAAVLKTVIGAALFWGVRFVPHSKTLLEGWCGMIGLVLMLHFGTFHLLALYWRQRGIAAEPLMRAPLLSTSLGDFWGNRWNLAFRQIGYELVFQPYRARIGPAFATMIIFVFSGLIHDAVISLPARGGYGLPTAYFVIQGLGILTEKTRAGKRLGLGRGVTGRAFALVVAAGPAYWLFHPTFVMRVMIPFMQAAGALGGLR